MAPIKVFFLEPTENVRLYLRRYSDKDCTGKYSYHTVAIPIGEASALWTERHGRRSLDFRPEEIPHDDPRWPKQCTCGYEFQEDDKWQLSQDLLYKRLDTGEIVALKDAPPGAMWYADWYISEGSDRNRGPDGHCLVVRIPDPPDGHHDWIVDTESNNCTRKGDHSHKCWVRHGDPRTGDVHVDKNGNTCKAGGGSIMTKKWHGFLHHGYLKTC